MREYARWILDPGNMSITDQLKNIVRATGVEGLYQGDSKRRREECIQYYAIV